MITYDDFIRGTLWRVQEGINAGRLVQVSFDSDQYAQLEVLIEQNWLPLERIRPESFAWDLEKIGGLKAIHVTCVRRKVCGHYVFIPRQYVEQIEAQELSDYWDLFTTLIELYRDIELWIRHGGMED